MRIDIIAAVPEIMKSPFEASILGRGTFSRFTYIRVR